MRLASFVDPQAGYEARFGIVRGDDIVDVVAAANALQRPVPATSVKIVTSGVAGKLSRKARLKFGMSDTTRSRSPCFQNSFNSRTWPP